MIFNNYRMRYRYYYRSARSASPEIFGHVSRQDTWDTRVKDASFSEHVEKIIGQSRANSEASI